MSRVMGDSRGSCRRPVWWCWKLSLGISPSALLPARMGCRGKTDARDAAQLTRLLRLGEIAAVTLPEADVEAGKQTGSDKDHGGKLLRTAAVDTS
jgi:hypothetical protein